MSWPARTRRAPGAHAEPWCAQQRAPHDQGTKNVCHDLRAEVYLIRGMRYRETCLPKQSLRENRGASPTPSRAANSTRKLQNEDLRSPWLPPGASRRLRPEASWCSAPANYSDVVEGRSSCPGLTSHRQLQPPVVEDISRGGFPENQASNMRPAGEIRPTDHSGGEITEQRRSLGADTGGDLI